MVKQIMGSFELFADSSMQFTVPKVFPIFSRASANSNEKEHSNTNKLSVNLEIRKTYAAIAGRGCLLFER